MLYCHQHHFIEQLVVICVQRAILNSYYSHFQLILFFLCPESHVQKIQRKAVPKTDRPQAENARRIKGKTATDCFAKMCAFNSFLCNPLGSCIQ